MMKVIAASVLVQALISHAQVMRGINVGGWLVLESWIRPSLYKNNSVADGAGEWQFCAQLGQSKCADVLTQHHAEWFTFTDMQTLASAGFTHLRIPIGYWILGSPFIAPGEPYVSVGWSALVSAIGWAYTLGMKIVVDMHGAPGSQNGHDNSGFSGPIGWLNGTNRERTTAALVELALRLNALNSTAGYAGAVVAIETLNEPWTTQVGGPIQFTDLAAWYTNATNALRAAGWSGDIWHHDGFGPGNPVWAGWLPSPQYSGIHLDTHQYYCFGGYTGLKPWALARTVCANSTSALYPLTDRPPLVVGEWSLGMEGAVSPHTPLSPEGTLAYRGFAEAQLDAWGMLGPGLPTPHGGFFWCHRTESSLDWSVLDGLAGGYFPNLTLAADPVLGNGRITCSDLSRPWA